MGGIGTGRAIAISPVLLAFFLLPVAAAYDTAAVGVGEATFPGCPPDRSAISGAADGAVWTFTLADANPHGVSCGVASGDVFHGPWDPELGGCLDGTIGSLCLLDPIEGGLATQYTLDLCLALADCVHGTATIVFRDL